MSNVNELRTVIGYENVGIRDDFGFYMEVGDIVEIHVMPFDYKVRGRLIFCEKRCAFYVKCDVGEYSLAHYENYCDMGANIEVTQTFRLIAIGG